MKRVKSFYLIALATLTTFNSSPVFALDHLLVKEDTEEKGKLVGIDEILILSKAGIPYVAFKKRDPDLKKGEYAIYNLQVTSYSDAIALREDLAKVRTVECQIPTRVFHLQPGDTTVCKSFEYTNKDPRP